jgi:hypothetical protein
MLTQTPIRTVARIFYCTPTPPTVRHTLKAFVSNVQTVLKVQTLSLVSKRKMLAASKHCRPESIQMLLIQLYSNLTMLGRKSKLKPLVTGKVSLWISLMIKSVLFKIVPWKLIALLKEKSLKEILSLMSKKIKTLEFILKLIILTPSGQRMCATNAKMNMVLSFLLITWLLGIRLAQIQHLLRVMVTCRKLSKRHLVSLML